MKAIRDAQLGTVSCDLIQGYWEKSLWILGPFPDLCNYDKWNKHVVFSPSRMVFSVFCWWSTASSVAPVDWQYDIWNEVSCTAIVSRGSFTGHLLVVGVKCVIPNAQFAVIKRTEGKKEQTNKFNPDRNACFHAEMLQAQLQFTELRQTWETHVFWLLVPELFWVLMLNNSREKYIYIFLYIK